MKKREEIESMLEMTRNEAYRASKAMDEKCVEGGSEYLSALVDYNRALSKIAIMEWILEA